MMMWMMPIMSLWIGFTLPASLGVYWIANSVLMLVQEKVLNKYFKKSMAAEDEAREKARMEDRLRRMEEARVAQQQREAEKKSLKEKQKAAQRRPRPKRPGRPPPRTAASETVRTREAVRSTPTTTANNEKELVLDDQVY